MREGLSNSFGRGSKPDAQTAARVLVSAQEHINATKKAVVWDLSHRLCLPQAFQQVEGSISA